MLPITIKTEEGEKSGFIDKTGKIVIEPAFDLVSEFSEGLCGVMVVDDMENERWGFIDKTGKVVVKPFYSFIRDGFKEGLAPVKFNGRWGVIIKTGKLVVDYKFEEIGSFSEGLCMASTEDKTGFIDKTGKFTEWSIAR